MKTLRVTSHFPKSLLLLAAFLLSACYFNVSAFSTENTTSIQQNYDEYKGSVYDAKTKDPLTFADITLKGTNISTITNTEGEFMLKVPKDQSNGIIEISFLGYTKKELSLTEFKNNCKIYLEPSVSELSEVVINRPETALALVEATLKKKGENYINQQNIMTGFYRETIKKRRKNASLSEAVVEIYKQPYNSNKKDKVKVIKSRKDADYSRLDTLALKLQGGPFSTLYVDMIKYNEFIFDFDTMKYYDFSFDNSTQINDQNVFVVNFKQKAEVDAPLYYGKLFIDTENYALVSAVYNLNVEDEKEASKLFVKKKPARVDVYPKEAAYRVDYRTHNGKWHYRYSNVQLMFVVDWKGKLFNSKYSLNSEMAITDWKEDASKRLSSGESFKPSMILMEEASGFSDPEFWGEYNIIEPEKSIESAIEKISKKMAKN